jgi:ribosomal protein S18 acetylase RimI-like enzyme
MIYNTREAKMTSLIQSLLVFLALVTSSLAFSTPTFGLGAIFFRPKNVEIAPNLGEINELTEAATFFTDAFWAGKVGGVKELSSRQLKSLGTSQIKEFRKRYGTKTGSVNDRRSELIVCKNSLSGEIYGCAGIEVTNISTPNGKSVQFSAPLMSNLAIGKQYRRKGLAEDLVKATEDLALKKWGYNDCYLFVEKRNAPAVKLYRKLGYKTCWEDDTATTLTPTKNGNVITTPTTIICMKKNLRSGLFDKLFGK